MESKKAAELISENLKSIYGYAFARLYDKEDVDDLTSEIICEVLKSAGRIRNDDAFWAFLWKVAENTFRKFIRQKERRSTFLPFPDDDSGLNAEPSPEEELTERAVRSESLMLLRRELSLLSEMNREVCLAYYFQNKSCTEIASEKGISSEMVKYHLFKTRQLLKEGIGMERSYGEKSYRPAKFEFQTIFTGKLNPEYRNLFERRLPGNILHSAYYTPMTIRELSIELGISSVYMEDEVALLEKYGLITPLAGGKYQTDLMIFTSDYLKDFYSKVSENGTVRIGKIMHEAKNLLPAIRQIGFWGNTLEDDHLLWALLWLIMSGGLSIFISNLPKRPDDELYSGTTGINYGTDYDPSDFDPVKDGFTFEEFRILACGQVRISERYQLDFADFGVLPENCHYNSNFTSINESVLSGSGGYPTFTREELAAVEAILREPIEEMGALYGEMKETAVLLMKQYAPKSVKPVIEKTIEKTLFVDTVGFIGKWAVDSGELTVRDYGKPVALYVSVN